MVVVSVFEYVQSFVEWMSIGTAYATSVQQNCSVYSCVTICCVLLFLFCYFTKDPVVLAATFRKMLRAPDHNSNRLPTP